MMKINLEREFFKVARDLEKKADVKEAFLRRITEHCEDWIENEIPNRPKGRGIF